MGYDMYVVDHEGNDVDCEHNYWRRNLGGGSAQARMFIDLDLGYWDTRTGPWPDVEYDNEIEDYTPEAKAILHPYLKAAAGGPGIPVRKLCDTNDGWWVTQEECQSFLDLWAAKGKPPVDKFGDQEPYGDTIPFIMAAAQHGGFRVY